MNYKDNNKIMLKPFIVDCPTNKFLKKVIFGKYQVIKTIGKSAFSSVFLGKCLNEKKYVAIKIQSKNANISPLEKEAYYQFLLKGLGIPKIITFGRSGRFNILVETLLGKTVKQLFKLNKNPQKKMKDMCMTAIQIIDRIEYIHSKNIVHQDIKPENFLVGNPDTTIIYIIDFGLSKKYRSSRTGKHIAFSLNKRFNGSLNFSSVNSMRGAELSRRDDLESIGYMLIYLVNDGLPWSSYEKGQISERFGKIFSLKANIKNEELCKGFPSEMCDYMNYVKSLKFEENPNYIYLRKLFISILDKMNEKYDLKFSWVKGKGINKKNTSLMSSLNGLRGRSPFFKLLYNIKEKSIIKSINTDINKIEKEEIKKNSLLFSKIKTYNSINQRCISNGHFGFNKSNLIKEKE